MFAFVGKQGGEAFKVFDVLKLDPMDTLEYLNDAGKYLLPATRANCADKIGEWWRKRQAGASPAPNKHAMELRCGIPRCTANGRRTRRPRRSCASRRSGSCERFGTSSTRS